ncbi:HET-domain-containing protein [Podospora fimiseda]|uniref:HET-domain-containing protein n=1 Tax=Podospora fimiseda TaxID=252190 RepID=A0AAN7BF21_9PEZI|nr:HET-domain-containing protein [Podospora fimiseda]
MRLLNAQTRKLEEFFDHQIPVYAILSHTWGANELIYDDITGPTPLPPNVKIDGCCEKALSQKIDYVWIDTLCINKSSSAELSEAINSMFQWYRSASICYAYLSDVSGVPRPELGQNDYQYLSRKGPTSFSASRWFTRSWTLQELLAPEKVQFYDQKWNMIGEKEKSSNHPHLGSGRHFIDDGRGWVKIDRPSLFYLALSRITGIPILVLSGDAELEEVCVAERMSWAADRQTTRKEDIAYSLMGIFGVNMAMLYGEGDRAFIRLQEEIIQRSDDDSIFAWGLGSTNHMSRPSSQLLAFSPTDFKATLSCPLLEKSPSKSEPNRTET